ncbi:MAG: hypothetical protein JXX28_12130 [Deltaproteobacteria bacterium]|nr:hypothetical protein [Deltaproteobacteria bacterium]
MSPTLLAALAAGPTTWALEMDTASLAKVPVLGWQRSVTHTRALVRLEPDGTWTQWNCEVSLHGSSSVAHTELPAAFVGALRPIRAHALVDGDALRVDLGLSAVGWDPLLGPLPAKPSDPAVVDHEGDGRPGGTVVLEVYGLGRYGIEVAHASHAVLRGAWDGEGWSGKIQTLRLEQRVLGADHRVLRASPVLRPLEEASTFTLRSTEATSCEALR